LYVAVADLGIDGRGAPLEVWALPRIGGLGAGGRAPTGESGGLLS